MKNTCKNLQVKMSLWFAAVFIIFSREGKFKPKNNQLFSWLKKEGKTEAVRLIGWTVGPVSAKKNPLEFIFSPFRNKDPFLA